MEPKVPIKEKISKFWNRPNPQNDLGILGAAAEGLLKGAFKFVGALGRQKATYDVSLSTQYFYNQNKPEFGTIRAKKAEEAAAEKRSADVTKASVGLTGKIQTSLEGFIENLKQNEKLNKNFDMTITPDSNKRGLMLKFTYLGKALGEYKIGIKKR